MSGGTLAPPRRSYRFNIGLEFADVVEAHAQRIALRYPDGSAIRYRELDERANRMARWLRAERVGMHDVIAIVNTKTVECFALMLACLKIGAIYVNIDDQNPPMRLRHIFAAARPKLVCGVDLAPPIRVVAASSGCPAIDVRRDDVCRQIARYDPAEPDGMACIPGSAPAYIMFTSGSTGVPKGALITHANVLNFALWAGELFRVTCDDVFANVNPMYFDNSVFDFFASVLNGAAMIPIAREVLAVPATMIADLERAGCTIWFSVPSLLVYLSMLKLLSADRLPDVRAFVFGGEGYPKAELRKLFDCFSGRARLVNVYGPTECTCMCSAWDVREVDFIDPARLVTLGPIAPNFGMLVLDERDRPVDAGNIGELCLVGPQVGLGYINDPDRTEQSFVRNPRRADWPERMYRTGDLVRLRADGWMLDFVGRSDNQIKHMGYRIELEEIEAALNALPGVTGSIVVQRVGRRELKSLVAYVAIDRDAPPDGLRDELAALLPPYMIPNEFTLSADLPKNANGKLDRARIVAQVRAGDVS